MRAAFDRKLPKAKALSEQDVLMVNVDVPTTMTTVLGGEESIASLRERIVDEPPKFDITRFDNIEIYAVALGHSHALLH